MIDALILFSKFTTLFDKGADTKPVSLGDIQNLENTLKIKLPNDFKIFMHNYGDVYSPSILDVIVDNNIEMNDVQQFLPPEEIISDKRSGFTSQIKKADLIPFASDCMGNIYAFKTSDIKGEKLTAKVYFFDHDFDTIENVAESFTELIEEFIDVLSPLLKS